MVQSKSRTEIIQAALTAGWSHTQCSSYEDEFVRELKLPGTPLEELADIQGFPLREKVTVTFSLTGAVISGWHCTPRHQAALDGRWIDADSLPAPRKVAILATLRDTFTL